ncbi:hypothetical protein Poly59_30650 [Rubripirellula reticaptiva]|uniref:Uncharacterized protein n=1 Tax=Rubripirellula reticaptiva TaxID=2528013 RepID=A0A5C6ENY7_9BACT|nr:hypothetical protein Poly59_30650 [Rubripirellula reticaptiva]
MISFLAQGPHYHENSIDHYHSDGSIRRIIRNNAVLLRPSSDLARSEPDLRINANRGHSRRIAAPTPQWRRPNVVATTACRYYCLPLLCYNVSSSQD